MVFAVTCREYRLLRMCGARPVKLNMTWHFLNRAVKVKSQKSWKDNYVLSRPEGMRHYDAHLMYWTVRIRRDIRSSHRPFLLLWAALFQGWVNFTPLFVSIIQPWVCAIEWHGAHLQGSKTRNGQDIPAEPQTVFLVVTGAVPGLSVFYSLVCFDF